ncbi:MAG: hypothetical protein KF708_01835 [Pirellulales bacterium]|nr:hypothetical protein [Pirellulales bacterium]
MKAARGLWHWCAPWCALILLFVALGGRAARAADDAPSLARLVPADAGLYIEFDDLVSHASDFFEGEFHKRLIELPPLAKWRQENQIPIGSIIEALSRQLGVSADEFKQKLLGRKAAVAVWPGAGAPAGGLFLLEAADQKLLERAMLALADAHRRVGDLKQEGELEHAGSKYRVRTLDRGENNLSIYVATLGPIGVLTGSEAVMHQVLELHAATEVNEKSLAGTRPFAVGSARWKENAAVKKFVNPRSFEEQMVAELDRVADDAGVESEAPFLRQAIVEAWRASDYWVTSIEVGPRVAVDSFFHLDRQRIPAALQRVIDSLGGEATFLRRVPNHAFFAFAGRVNLGHLSSLFLAASDLENFEEVRDMAQGLLLGLDLFDDVLTSLGPDMGAYLASRESDAADGERQLDLVLGVEVQEREEGDDRPQASTALKSGLRTVMTLGANFINQDRDEDEVQAEVRMVEIEGVKLTSLEGAGDRLPGSLPGGLMATYGFVDRYLLFGSSIEAVSLSLHDRGTDSLAESPEIARVLGSTMSPPSQVLFIRCDEFREFLESNRGFFASVVSMTRGLDRQTTQRSLDQLADVLKLAETIALAASFEENGLHISIELDTAEELPMSSQGE